MAYLKRSHTVQADEDWVSHIPRVDTDDYGYDFDCDAEYVERMRRILSGYPHLGCPPEPSVVASSVYLGTSSNAENHAVLRKYRITHILNCSGRAPNFSSRFHKPAFPPEVGVKQVHYLGCEDSQNFNLIHHFYDAFAFISRAVLSGGRALIYCDHGVSLSGAIAIGYLIYTGIDILAATKDIKDTRRIVLSNTNFMRQLVTYARGHGRLDKYPDAFPIHEYGGRIDRRRLMFAHFPLEMF